MSKNVLSVGDFRIHRNYGAVKIVKVFVRGDQVIYHVMTERGTTIPTVFPTELV